MIKSFTRSLIAGLAVFSIILPGLQASASTGPWNWTDLSTKVAERVNHPIWAIARGDSYWYFTDGQDLHTSGHVWRTDGGILTDITKDLKVAGLTRVDDIVSDGQTVLFLKNVTTRNNSLEVVSYNGNYSNITWQIRPYLNGSTGIASIEGKNGTWAIVTTSGQVIFWNAAQNMVNTFLTGNSNFQSDIYYSMRHVAPADSYFYMPVSVAPISTGWLVSSRDTNGVTRFWTYTSYGVSTEVTGQFSRMTNLQLMSSNGNVTVFGGVDIQNGTKRMYTYDGVNVKDITSAVPGSMNTWNSLIGDSNGTSWMFLGNGPDNMSKRLYRFDGTSFQDLGATQDLFLTISGNQNGTFLIGGVLSDYNHVASPSLPLTGKLVKVTEDIYNYNNTNTYWAPQYPVSQTGDISVWNTLEPSGSTLLRNNSVTQRVQASATQGLRQIDVYANGSVRRTCNFSYAYGTQNCDAVIYGTDFANGTLVSLNARATDMNGRTTWTDTRTVTISDYGYTGTSVNTNTTNSTGGSSWIWSVPEISQVTQSQPVTFNMGAWDPSGIRRIDIYANNAVVNACDFGLAYGNQNCTYQVSTSYNGITYANVSALITNGKNQTFWSQTKNYTITNGTTDYQYPTTYPTTYPAPTTPSFPVDLPGSIRVTSDHDSGYFRNQRITFTATAADQDGVDRIEILVNAELVKTCYNTQTCSYTSAAHSKFNAISYGAKITDKQSFALWTGYKTIYKK